MDQENNQVKPVRRRKSAKALTARILRSFIDSSDSTSSKIISIKEICEAEEDEILTAMQIRYWMKHNAEYIVRCARPENTKEAGARTLFYKLTQAGIALAQNS